MINLKAQLNKMPPKNGLFYTVAIDGRGGSGKTELAKHTHKLLSDFVLLNGDDYFEPSHDGVAWGHFNDTRFIQDVITPLQTGPSFIYRPYDWHTEPHISQKPITVQNGLILERCYSFGLELDWDLRIWVETPSEVCLERGIAREHMSKEKVIKAWQVWQQTEDEYIQTHGPKEAASIVISGTEPFSEQLG